MSINKRYQIGLTMIELMAVLVIGSFMAYVAVTRMEAASGDRIIDNAARKSVMVSNAAKRFRMDTGAWPTSPNQLVSQNYLTNEQVQTGFGNSFSFSTIGQNLRITQGTPEARLARRLSGVLPEGSVSGTSVAFLTPPAGAEASLAGLYARDGSRALTGDMDGGNNNASNFNNISANNNLTAGNQVNARRFVDSDNTSYYIDPASTSNVNELRASGRVYASSFYDSDDSNYYLNPSAASRLKGNLSTEAELHADTLRSRTNTGYYLRPNSTSNVRGTITTEGDMRASVFRDRSNPTNRYVDPAGTSQINDLRVARIEDLNNTNYFLDPSSSLEAGRFRGWVTADRFNFRTTKSVGAWCSSSRNEVAITSDGELLTCQGTSWALAGTATKTRFVHRDYVLWSCTTFGGQNGTCGTSFTRTLTIPDEAFAAQIYASCSKRRDASTTTFTVESDGNEVQILRAQGGGSYAENIATNSHTVSVEESKTVIIRKKGYNSECTGNFGFQIRLVGYWINE